MKFIVLVFSSVFLLTCNFREKPKDPTSFIEATAPIAIAVKEIQNQNTVEDSVIYYQTYFLVIADTSLNYYELSSKMHSLSKSYQIAIDTLGRYYNLKKDLIALPDDAEDEIYAGEYFPRRFPSETLSLEYLSGYKDNTNEKMIALVCGIYDNKRSADSLLKIIGKTEKVGFVLKSKIYVGCIH